MSRTKPQQRYTLTDAHRAQLGPWADRWIANALSTKPMDDADRVAMRVAIRGLYEAAGLTPPPDQRIVFVPSPFVARFAGGFAAAIWWLRGQAAATSAATSDATDDATSAATRAATYAATSDATYAATRDATDEATRAATDDWYAGIGDMVAVARQIAPNRVGFLLKCAQFAYRMWNGGNQYSAWVSFLSFFRHVAQLDLPEYDKFQHYEAAAIHAGPRVMHREFCIVSDRPELLTLDEQHRPHNDTGPFCRWRDGTRLYAVHGVRVPARIVEHPETITAAEITAERNAEVRRVMLNRFGEGRYIEAIGATALDTSDYGTLYRAELDGDEPLVMVKVTNATPEPDGSYKDYWLRCHPELRPIKNGQVVGEPQAMRARNAVAASFGRRGEDYEPVEQT